MRLVFVTYANQVYDRALERITAEAKRFPFDEVCAVREIDLFGSEFWSAHGAFIQANPRGAGYWLWKPYIVGQMLATMADGDVLLYADAGCTLDASKLPRFSEYVHLVSAHPSGVLAFNMAWNLQRFYTKKIVVDEVGADLDIGQIAATAFMMRASPETRALVAEWLALCSKHSLIDNSPSVAADGTLLPEDPSFREHRHDQAIWSLLLHKRCTALLLEYELAGGPIRDTRIN
jgi:hypothetical protein